MHSKTNMYLVLLYFHILTHTFGYLCHLQKVTVVYVRSGEESLLT